MIRILFGSSKKKCIFYLIYKFFDMREINTNYKNIWNYIIKYDTKQPL